MTLEVAPGVPKKYISREEATAYLGLSKKALENLHWKGLGPPYLSGAANRRPVLYDIAKLDAWIAANYVEK